MTEGHVGPYPCQRNASKQSNQPNACCEANDALHTFPLVD